MYREYALITGVPNERILEVGLIREGHSTIYFFDLHQNVYSEVASKKARKSFASKYTISYQNKDFNKSNVCNIILSQIRLQRLNLDKSALVDIFTNIILE